MPKENLDHLTPEAKRFLVDLHIIFKEHPQEINEIVNGTMIGMHISPLSHYLLEHQDIVTEAKKLEDTKPQQSKRFSFPNPFKK